MNLLKQTKQWIYKFADELHLNLLIVRDKKFSIPSFRIEGYGIWILQSTTMVDSKKVPAVSVALNFLPLEEGIEPIETERVFKSSHTAALHAIHLIIDLKLIRVMNDKLTAEAFEKIRQEAEKVF